MPNNHRILHPKKRDKLWELILESKTDDEIRTELERPGLDVAWFRRNMEYFSENSGERNVYTIRREI